MEERKNHMKRLVGGDFLLDMSPIELELSVDGTTKTNITDNEVLGQLTDLKRFIGSPSMVKPIWCKLTNGETDELIVARGILAVVDVGEFEICIPLNGYKLTISVEFTQMETEDHEPLDDWYIDANDAKYILISDAQSLAGELADFEGDVSINGDLTVSGSINGEENPSVKPIYCHPITINFGAYSILTMLIFNGDGTPFTKETLIAYLKAETTKGRYMVNGALYSTNYYLSPAYCAVATSGTEEGNLILLGVDSAGTAHGSSNDPINFETIIMNAGTFNDEVNQIN